MVFATKIPDFDKIFCVSSLSVEITLGGGSSVFVEILSKFWDTTSASEEGCGCKNSILCFSTRWFKKVIKLGSECLGEIILSSSSANWR